MKTLLNIGTYKYVLRYYEKDLNRNIKLVSLFNFMQDVAAMHAEKNGFGENFVFSNNMAWFLLKLKLDIFENINDAEEIEIKTESRGISKLFAFRDFYFYNNNKLFAKANSQWALVDFDSKKIIKPQGILDLQAYEKKEDDLEFEKIPNIENPMYKKEFRIRFDDIDINKHVNNVNYPAWALECLAFEFRNKHIIKSVDIYYKKDIDTAGKIISEAFLDEQNFITIHSIKNAQTGEDLCSAKIKWAEM